MPIWAPVGGRPGAAMNGHSTGAWSEVIRHTDTGARVEAAQPLPARRGPRADVCRNSRGCDARTGSVGAGGRSWPKSASRRVTPRPVPRRPIRRPRSAH